MNIPAILPPSLLPLALFFFLPFTIRAQTPHEFAPMPDAPACETLLRQSTSLSEATAQPTLPQFSNEHWVGGYGMPGLEGKVWTMVWDKGELYVGGEFTTAGGLYIHYLASWDGSEWHSLGTGVDGPVRTIAIDGDNVYVGGEFTSAGGKRARRIAVWNRSSKTWSPLGNGVGGLPESVVNSITIREGQVYAGGYFIAAGEIVSVNIARWDGRRWHRVGTGMNDIVHRLFADEETLYAAGEFTLAGNVPVKRFARYDIPTGTWHDPGVEISGLVSTMVSDSRYLYLGGSFSRINGQKMPGIARMDKSTGEWSTIGEGLTGSVGAIVLRGNEIIAGGTIYGIPGTTLPDGYRVQNIAKWDGAEWSAFARRSALSGKEYGSSGVMVVSRAESLYEPGLNASRNINGAMISAMALDDRGDLYMGGLFDLAGPVSITPGLQAGAGFVYPDPEAIIAKNICKLSGNDTVWLNMGNALDNYVYALADDGDGLYAGGEFIRTGLEYANRIARFHKSSRRWEPLEEGTDSAVLALATDNVPVGRPDLYVGGTFTTAGRIRAKGLARWNASERTWSRVGARDFDSVSVLSVINGALYAGGSHGLARWDGTSWTTLIEAAEGNVTALAYDNGLLYASGSFDRIGNVPAQHIAALNTTTGEWKELGEGIGGTVRTLCVWNGRLYAGGAFGAVAGMPTQNMAIWDPAVQQWSAFETGLHRSGDEIRAITPGRFGLYIAGRFKIIDTSYYSNSVILWDGSEWRSLGNGLLKLAEPGTVHAMIADDESLYVGSTAWYAGGKSSLYFAQWRFPPANSIITTNGPEQERIVSGATEEAKEPERSKGQALQSSPNPFTTSSVARLIVPAGKSGPLTLTLCDPLGRTVRTLLQGSFEEGEHEIRIEGNDLPSGIYFLRLHNGEKIESLPLIRR